MQLSEDDVREALAGYVLAMDGCCIDKGPIRNMTITEIKPVMAVHVSIKLVVTVYVSIKLVMTVHVSIKSIMAVHVSIKPAMVLHVSIKSLMTVHVGMKQDSPSMSPSSSNSILGV